MWTKETYADGDDIKWVGVPDEDIDSGLWQPSQTPTSGYTFAYGLAQGENGAKLYMSGGHYANALPVVCTRSLGELEWSECEAAQPCP